MASGTALDSLTAARMAFRQLFVPGLVALSSDAVGFITLLLIDIGVIRELAMGASVGVAVIILTNLIFLPVLISYIGISKKAITVSRENASRENPLWRWIARFASPKVAPVSIALALCALVLVCGTGRI